MVLGYSLPPCFSSSIQPTSSLCFPRHGERLSTFQIGGENTTFQWKVPGMCFRVCIQSVFGYSRRRHKPVMQKLVEKSRRVLQGTAHVVYGGFPSPVSMPRPVLPTSFNHAHEIISQYAERVESRSIMQGMGFMASSDLGPFMTSNDSSSSRYVQNTWLPDLYRFSSVGLSVEERYTFASAQPTPFIPSSPRIAEDKNFNFDHGALTTELVEETSYMAWF